MWLASFWRRTGAFLIDLVVLALIGHVLAFFLEDFFVGLGQFGPLVGFGVALSYFAPMSSALCDGQTLGKRVLKIRVVGPTNAPVGLGKSMIRYVVLCAPYFLNGVGGQDPSAPFAKPVEGLIFVLVVVGGFSIGYLYVFNRVTRQSLHDRVCNTFVVDASAEIQKLGKFWKPHFLIILALLVLTTVSMRSFFSSLPLRDVSYEGLAESTAALMQDPSVDGASVVVRTATVASLQADTTQGSTLIATAFHNTDRIAEEAFARSLAELVSKHYGVHNGTEVLTMQLVYGFNIGIASNRRSHVYQFDLAAFDTNE
ncbi:MAG: RDD family protein [Gammaproteobacteria bacterium]|nr:RDD family protein [Gammaproteobacteria bacterium]